MVWKKLESLQRHLFKSEGGGTGRRLLASKAGEHPKSEITKIKNAV